PAADGLPIVRNLVAHDEDVGDIHVPLLLWWAIESWCEKDRDRVLAMFEEPAVWQLPMVQTHLLHRLMRRFAQSGVRKDLVSCARLLKLCPTEGGAAAGKALMRGFEEAYQGRPLAGLPTDLAEALSRFGGESISLGLRQNKPEAIAKALAIIANDSADNSERL